jgi:hypothetical protein
MKFFLRRTLAWRWNSFVLASPTLIQVNLERFLIFILFTAARPRTLAYASLCS